LPGATVFTVMLSGPSSCESDLASPTTPCGETWRGETPRQVFLLNDITAIVDGQSQADPQFRTNRLYARLTATEVRRQLIAQYSYRDEDLPTAETIATKLNELGVLSEKSSQDSAQKNCPKPTQSLPK
jgi:hypothetical protein